MAESEESLRRALAEKQSVVDAQAEAVRALKARPEAAQSEIDAAVGSNGDGSTAGSREAFLQAVVNALERRLFYIPSFKIYRGVGGLYDYGPPGCAVKSKVLAFWRQHFVLEENMLEVDCS